MAVVENRFVCDLSKPVQAQALKGNVFSLDNFGSRISVLIYNNGQPATISGSITSNCILPDGSTVNVNGTLTTENGGSKAYIDVPQGCLLIPGILKIAIKCTSSSVITTLAAIVANVYMTKTDNVITPSQQIINDWNAEISAAIATQNAAIANQDTKINDLKNASIIWDSISNDGEHIISGLDLESGFWAFSTKTANPKRLRNKSLYPVFNGMQIKYTNPSQKVYFGVLPTETAQSYLQVTGWINASSQERVVDIVNDGWLVIIVEDTTNISPSDYDCSIAITSEAGIVHEIVRNKINVILNKFPPVASVLSNMFLKTVGNDDSFNKANILYTLFNGEYEGLDFLQDEDNSPLEFPILRLKELTEYKNAERIQQTDKFGNLSSVLADLVVKLLKINGGSDKDEELYSLFEGIYEGLDSLEDQDGTSLEFPNLRLKELKEYKNLVRETFTSKFGNSSAEFAKRFVDKSKNNSPDISGILEYADDIIADPSGNPLLEEDGEMLTGNRLQVKDAYAFNPVNYQYNSGVNGYYEYLAIPILYLYGDTSSMTKDVKANLTARFKDIHMGCSCKWQGSSSIAYPKKNYTITFKSPVTLVNGWGAKKKYVLKSEFFDNTHTRNTVSARLWAEMVRNRESGKATPNPIASAPGAGATDGFHVMVVMNNKYIGLYTLGIPKDDWMFGMDDGSENCCVLNAEKNTNATKFSATTTAEEIDAEATFTIEYASDDMDLNRITTSINNAISAVVNYSGVGSVREALEDYFDYDSVMDYLIFSLLTGNWDGLSHNYNLATYDGVKWTFSAYDLDNTFGMEDLSGWEFNKLYDDPTVLKPTIPFPISDSRLLYMVLTYDKETFKARYSYLRRTILSENHIYTSFYNFICCVSQRVLAEEFRIWPTTPRSGAQNIGAILNFYRLRCAYMDEAVANL